MKQLDLKSFAIGILLTTTVVFGVAATNPTSEKQWDENQRWVFLKMKRVETEENPKKLKFIAGFEPFAVEGETIWYRRPMDSYASLMSSMKKRAERLGYTDEDLRQ